MAVAGFIGTPPMNLLAGIWQGDTVTVAGRPVRIAHGTAEPRAVMLGVRPGDLRIVEPGADRRRSDDAGLAATVERVEDLGDSTIVSFVAAAAACGAADRDANGEGDGEPRLIKLKSDRPQQVAEGQIVNLGFAPQAAHLFDAVSGARL